MKFKDEKASFKAEIKNCACGCGEKCVGVEAEMLMGVEYIEVVTAVMSAMVSAFRGGGIPAKKISKTLALMCDSAMEAGKKKPDALEFEKRAEADES